MTTIEGAIAAFRAAAIAKGDFAEPAARDLELHAAMASAVAFLRARGPAGETALRELLADEAAAVRAWVAAELLARGHAPARDVLRQLVSAGGVLGFAAAQTLAAHDAGRLRSPFGS